jgi:predicted nucleic acid-binding protein
VRFWDSSAVVPLLIDEKSSPAVFETYVADPDIVAWWATEVECVSALARLERDGAMDSSALGQALGRLDQLALAWHEVQPTDRIRQLAIRLLRVHQLRAGDAFQLAAAITAAEDQPTSLPLVTLDLRLADAADREGFTIDAPAVL